MSRSNQTDYAENPSTRFFDWAGGTGSLVHYDRELKENVEVALPFRFLILDEVATVGGGIDDGNGFVGYYSNAIRPRDAKISSFTVRSSSNGNSRIVGTGTWAEIKADVAGAKYIKGLYIAFFDESDQMQLGYLKIRGAAMRPWIDFIKEHKDIYAGAFSITDKNKAKKGSNVYYEPVFGFTDKIKDETNNAALAFDRDVLQPYLAAYFAQAAPVEQAVAATAGGGSVEVDDEVPEYAGQPYDDDDIPF